jgi:hypothetical protein
VTVVSTSVSHRVVQRVIARKKTLNGGRIMEVLFNEDSEDDLIPESDSSESSDSERPASPEIFLISDAAHEATRKHRKLLFASSTIYSKYRLEYRHSDH